LLLLPSSLLRRRAFTLVELVITLAVLALIMGALGSAVLVASRAAPDRASAADAVLSAEQGLDLIASELRYAQSVSQATPTSLTFTLPDRNGDGVAETVRYSWSAVAGTPLLRHFNGLPAAELLPDVQEFAFEYDRMTVTTTRETQSEVTSPEVLLASFTSWPGVSATANGFAPSATQWAAQVFKVDKVALPPTTTRVTINRALLMSKPGLLGTLSTFTVGIHRAYSSSDPRPTALPLGSSVNVSLSLLDFSYSWTEVRFPDVSVNKLEKDFAIVIKGVAGSNVRFQYLSAASAPRDTSLMRWTANSGSSWLPTTETLDQNDMPFYVYGTFTATTTTPVTVTRNYLKSVRVALRTGPAGASRLVTAVPVLEHPEMP
jgi:prepilin-type N-terminal cleavage/methylation domain-containing protein